VEAAAAARRKADGSGTGDHSTACGLSSISVAVPKIFPMESMESAKDETAANGKSAFKSTAELAVPFHSGLLLKN
jgi:hypothetical protein